MGATDLVKAAGFGFTGATWVLFLSKEHRLDASWLRKPLMNRLGELDSIQVAALVAIFTSLVLLIAFAGYAFVDGQRAKTIEKDEIEMEKKQNKGPSPSVRLFCTTASAATIAYTLFKGYTRYVKQVNTEEWPEHFGLFCGLGSVAVAQVCLIIYQFVRRNELLGDEQGLRVQLKEIKYERTFFGDVFHHFSNPGAFILMLPYLCLTWMFRLMPDSYYDYDSPVNWWHVLAQLVVVDFFTFVFHVAEHSIPDFYKVSHKPHHRFVDPHIFNAFDGSLADTVSLILFPLFATAHLLHVSNWDYIAFGTVYSTHFMLIHSEFAHPFDPFLQFFFVNICEDHHVHHAIFNSNFSHFFTIYDKLAGTYRSGSTIKGFRSYSMLTTNPVKQE